LPVVCRSEAWEAELVVVLSLKYELVGNVIDSSHLHGVRARPQAFEC
jgi:hypothetical protein